MLKTIIASISFLDFFQEPVTVLFQSKEKISTACNLILSFLVYAILIFVFSTSDMINKQNPKVTDQFVANSQTNIVLNNKNFGFFLKFVDKNYEIANKSDPSYFTIEILQIFLENSKIYNKNYLLHKCEKEDFFSDNICYDCLCLEKNAEINLNVYDRNMRQDKFSSLSIQINACSNDTSPIPCKSSEEIWDYFNGISMTLGFNEYFFDLNDYENPQRINQLNFKEIKFNKNHIQMMSIYLMEINLYQDSHSLIDTGEVRSGNYFQQDASQASSLNYFISDEDRLKNNDLKLQMASIWFYPSLNKRVIKRNYQKLTELLSQLGGLITFLKFTLGFFSSFSIHVKLRRSIYNELYFLKKKNKQKTIQKDSEYLRRDSFEESIEKEAKPEKIQIKTSPQKEMLYLRNQRDKEDNLKMKETSFENRNQKLIIEKDSKKYFNYKDKEKIIENSQDSKTVCLEIKQIQNNFQNQILENENKSKLFTLWYFIIQSIKKVFKMKEDDNSKLIAEIEEIYKKNFDIITIIKTSQEYS